MNLIRVSMVANSNKQIHQFQKSISPVSRNKQAGPFSFVYRTLFCLSEKTDLGY